MKSKKRFPELFKVFGLAAALNVASLAQAHNQSPATIRRSMEKVFGTLSAPLPANVYKGQRSLKVAGTTAQVFDAKKDGTIIGYVAQLEYREQTYIVGIESASGDVKSVIKDGSVVSEDEWKEFSFVGTLREMLVGKK